MLLFRVLFDIDSPITGERLLNKGDVVKSVARNQREIKGYTTLVLNKENRKVRVFKHEIEVIK